MQYLYAVIYLILAYHAAVMHGFVTKYNQVRTLHTLLAAGSGAGSNSGIVSYYEELKVPTLKGIYFADITPAIKSIIEKTGIKSGQVCVLSRHTTTSITINEMEARLVDDARQYLLKLAPPAYPYLHNDLHLRNGPPGKQAYLK